MIKFKCKDDKIIYLNPAEICQMDNLKDLDNFKSLFTNENLENKSDNDEILLLKILGITSDCWLEFISFIKYGVPMYYSLDIFNNPNKKESFIYNLEKLNITCSKFGGIKKFDDFYKNFLETCENNLSSYNPQEPTSDYKKLYQWGVGSIGFVHAMKNTYEKYNTEEGWDACKVFIKRKDPYIWFRKLKLTGEE